MKIRIGDVLLVKFKEFIDIVEVIKAETDDITLKIIHTSIIPSDAGTTYEQNITDLNENAFKLAKKDVKSAKLLYF